VGPELVGGSSVN